MPEEGASPDLLARLPHGGAARLPDTIRLLQPGVRVVAERTLAAGDPVMNAAGAFPASLLIELMAQSGGLLIEAGEGAPAGYGVLAGIQRLHLHATARAGETITVECSLTRRLGDLYRIDCRSRAGARTLAHGSIQIRRIAGEAR